MNKKDFNLIDEMENYLNLLDINNSSKRSYKNIIIKFNNYIDNKLKLTKEDAINYKNHLIKTSSQATTRINIIVLKNFFKELERKKVYENIFYYIKNIPRDTSFKRNSLTLTEARKLIKHANKFSDTLMGLRNYAIIQLMLTTGLRTIEIERANVSDIKKVNNQNVLYIHGKKRFEKDDYVLLPIDTYDVIIKYLLKRNDYLEPLFLTHSRSHKYERLHTRSIRRFIKEYLKQIDIDDDTYTAHSLRHTFATNLIKHGNISTQQLKVLLRHKHLSSTELYNHTIRRHENDGEIIMSKLLKGGKEDE